jgi:hypothetical protein
MVRPFAGAQELTLVAVNAGNLGIPWNRKWTGRHHAVRRFDRLAAIGRDLPQLSRLVPARALDARVELVVLAQVESVRHEVEVGQQLRLRRELFRPGPLLLDLG